MPNQTSRLGVFISQSLQLTRTIYSRSIMRAVIDTNVIIAGMLNTIGASYAVLMAIHRRQLTPVLPVPLVMGH